MYSPFQNPPRALQTNFSTPYLYLSKLMLSKYMLKKLLFETLYLYDPISFFYSHIKRLVPSLFRFSLLLVHFDITFTILKITE